MYLTERIIALLAYLFLLVIICFLIVKLGKKNIGKTLMVYVVLLSIMSFFYVPATGADLYRLIPIMHIWEEMSFAELLREVLSYSNPTYMLYMNLIGRAKIDGLLPAITCFIFYSNVFYILKKCAGRYNVSSIDIALVLFFFMSTGILIEVISSIRTLLGFSFISVCCYKEMVEKKSIVSNLPWYILASGLHPAVFVLTMIRISFLLIEYNKGFLKRVMKIVFLILVLFVLYFFGSDYFIASLQKAIEYLFYDSYSYLWEYIIGGITLIIIIRLIYLNRKLIRLEGDIDNIKNLLNFSTVISILLILFSFEYNIFHRFVIFLSIIAIPILFNLLSRESIRKFTRLNLRNFIFFMSILILFIACVRGNLCSLKFFIL